MPNAPRHVAPSLPDRYIDGLIKHGPKQVGAVVYDLAQEVKRLRAAIDEAAHYCSYADGGDEAAHRTWQVLKEASGRD